MKSTRYFGMLPALGVLAAVMVAFSPGCSDDKKPDSNHSQGGSGGDGGTGGVGGTAGEGPKTCESSDDCAEDERCDNDEKVCVPRCTADNQCPRDTGTYCDIPSGECIPGEPCQGDDTCGSNPKFSYCEDSKSCVCSPDASIERPATGVCWRRANTCQPCEKSFECGNTSLFRFEEADCRIFRRGDGDEGVCLPRMNKGRCPPGMIAMNAEKNPELADYCMPQSEDCGTMKPCEGNDDCTDPAAPVCDLVRQICIKGCSIDYQGGAGTIGCAPGLVCHATVAGMEPTQLDRCETASNYGIGMCGEACKDDSDCAALDPDSGFVCRSEGGSKRCRPAGCVDDSECEDEREPGSKFEPWCDAKTRQCVTDRCRVGFDKRLGCGTDKAYKDCAGDTLKCTEEGTTGFGICERKDCIDFGGKEVGCYNAGEFCTGEEYRSLMDGSKVGQTVQYGDIPGECASMDPNIWCNASCGSHADCKGDNAPQRYADSPALCMDFGLGDACTWGCEFEQECPSSYHCSSRGLEVDCTAFDQNSGKSTGFQTCESDDDCSRGNKCVVPMVSGGKAGFQGAEPFKVCECSDSGTCGGNFTCNAGLGTMITHKTTPGFEEITGRYCSNAGPCGIDGGSCEWFGQVIPENPNTGVPAHPRFVCGATPETYSGAIKATCPIEDGVSGLPVRRGKTSADQYVCVYSQICQPNYKIDPATMEAVCPK